MKPSKSDEPPTTMMLFNRSRWIWSLQAWIDSMIMAWRLATPVRSEDLEGCERGQYRDGNSLNDSASHTVLGSNKISGTRNRSMPMGADELSGRS